MGKTLLVIVFTIVLIGLQIFLPEWLLFVPIVVMYGIYISPKWNFVILLLFGFWLDSLFNTSNFLPFTVVSLLLGVTLETLRGKYVKNLFGFGLTVTLLFSFLYFLVPTFLADFHWFNLLRILLVLVINILTFSALYFLWNRLSNHYV